LHIGGPGQIDPFVESDIERWACDPAGPHVACPDALLARFPHLTPIVLPVTHRLVADTVQLIKPAFYPSLSFTAMTPSGGRTLGVQVSGMHPLDAAIDRAVRGMSVVGIEAPARITGEVDDHLARQMVTLIERLLIRGAFVQDRTMATPLTPDMIGIVSAHRSQVTRIRSYLPPALSGVRVETANRFQGLERPVMLVHHPLSGRADADTFHLETGRLCVSLSRHNTCCFIFERAGIEDMLNRYAPSGDRLLGLDANPEYIGWRAHMTVMRGLQQQSRIVNIP